jgi:glycerol kinase
MMAGLAMGVVSTRQICDIWQSDLVFMPEITEEKRAFYLRHWSRAVERATKWIETTESN